MNHFVARLKFLLVLACILPCINSHGYSNKATYAADAFFSNNSSKLMHEPSIAKLHDIVQRASLINQEVYIVVGHADSAEKGPLKLSVSRAEEIKRLLIQMGVESNTIYIEGKGATQPLLNTPDKNNRVEIEVVGTVGSNSGTTPKYPVTWRMLINQTSDLSGSPAGQIPAKLLTADRAAMPVIEFIQALDSPALRPYFASRLLNEAIWRKDDQLMLQAYAERQVAKAILVSQNRFVGFWYESAMEAVVYGTESAKRLMQSEFDAIEVESFRRFDALKRLICSPRRYPHMTPDLIRSAGAALYPAINFTAKFRGVEQYEILNCGFESKNSVFDWLIENGGNPDLTNNLGQTFLHLDIAGNGGQRVQMLLRHGANVKAVDYLGNTVLHQIDKSYIRSSLLGFPEQRVSKLEKQKLWDTLIAAGANPNQPNKAGQLPVHP